MRVLVYPHDLELGGSSINAIDLAAAVASYGHEALVIARPGPLARRVRDRGLELVTMDVPTRPRPWPGAVRAVREATRRFGVDLVHTYEFWPCVESYLAVGLIGRARVVSTIMTMGFAPYLPRTISMTLGYQELLEEVAAHQQAPSHLLVPPIDSELDRPGVDTAEFVTRHDLDPEATNVVIVSRVAREMKQEGIERTMRAVAGLADRYPVRLVVVGDGSAMSAVRRLGADLNRRVRRRVVDIIGALDDPRPAYQFADIVVGMGSSVLRGMAFEKPAIVVGVNGFSLPVAERTMPHFERFGFYGEGDEDGAGKDPLVAQLAELIDEPDRRRELGRVGRKLVEERYSLGMAARTLDAVYRQAVEQHVPVMERVGDTASTLYRTAVHKAQGRRLLPGG